MHIITKKRLREFAQHYPDAQEPLERWFKMCSKRNFVSFAEVKACFNAVDQVGKLTVFNIGGNKYRLIVAIHYNRRIIYIRHVLTHAEYDRGKWRED